jgi:hypothetical protein
MIRAGTELKKIDPKLVIPPDLPVPPVMADLGFHRTDILPTHIPEVGLTATVFPSLLLSLDALFLSPPWPTTPVNPRASLLSLISSIGIAFLYWFWIELCYSRNGTSAPCSVSSCNLLSPTFLFSSPCPSICPDKSSCFSRPRVLNLNLKLLNVLGFYPYPIFSLLNTAQRIGLFAVSGVAMWAAGAGLRYCYRVVNGIEEDSLLERREDKKVR